MYGLFTLGDGTMMPETLIETSPTEQTTAPIQHPAISFTISDPLEEKATIHVDGFFEMRNWQRRCFDELQDSQYWIINAPMASGKTFEMCAIAADRLTRTPKLKAIIAVPQTLIGAGFRSNKIQFPNGSRVNWSLLRKYDMCQGLPKNNASRLLHFLASDPSSNLMERVVLCSHMTLVRAFQSNPDAFKNLLLVIDEAHHVEHNDEDDNKIGAIVRHVFEHPELDLSLGLCTATFFRGDLSAIIPDRNLFKWFELPFDEYFRSCRHLKSFSYEFMLYGADYVPCVEHLFKKRIGKTIIYIPWVNSYGSLGSKNHDVAAILQALSGQSSPVTVTDGPITKVKRGDSWIKVVNLVDPGARDEKKEAIVRANDKDTNDEIDVVIALRMFKEGANWRWADREIIIGQRNSLTDLIQTVGRLFRDVEGKENVEVHHLLPFAFDQADDETLRNNLNDYLKAILLSMLFESIIEPVEEEPREPSDGTDGRTRINYLKEAVKSDSEAVQVLLEITEDTRDALALSPDNIEDEFEEIVSQVLFAHGVEHHHGQIARQLFRLFNRRTVRMRGLNVGHVNADLLASSPFGALLSYSSGVCDVRTFQDLRRASKAYSFRPFEQAKEFAHSLGLSSGPAWWDYLRIHNLPDDIPKSPSKVYSAEWKGWTDWLGTGFLQFEDARAFVRTLGLKTWRDWTTYATSDKKLRFITASPTTVYADQWISMNDWLGYGRHRPFLEARAFVHDLGFKGQHEWRIWAKTTEKPDDIPAAPNSVYSTEWVDWRDWLGLGARFLTFEQARSLTRGLGLTSRKDWAAYASSGRRPDNIPADPPRSLYRNEWISWEDWLGVGPRYLPFKQAREFVHALGISDWQTYAYSGERPDNIPARPKIFYETEWVSWEDWLNRGNWRTQRRSTSKGLGKQKTIPKKTPSPNRVSVNSTMSK